ncbi:hypothetical protein DVS77_06355 [Mycolicibacterium moriokaense]|nr:hypothetical protein DVS77_06355 [Mycolicibacterium moriokaense]
MSGNRISLGFFSIAQVQHATRHEALRVPLSKRVIAWLKANKFDRMLAVGVPVPEGSALALHAARLTSTEEREAIARTLRRVVNDVADNTVLVSSRIPLNVPNITAAGDRIDQVTLRLHSPLPVTARGVARLRVLLADGTGPMYRCGRGDLEGRLGAALAAL